MEQSGMLKNLAALSKFAPSTQLSPFFLVVRELEGKGEVGD